MRRITTREFSGRIRPPRGGLIYLTAKWRRQDKETREASYTPEITVLSPSKLKLLPGRSAGQDAGQDGHKALNGRLHESSLRQRSYCSGSLSFCRVFTWLWRARRCFVSSSPRHETQQMADVNCLPLLHHLELFVHCATNWNSLQEGFLKSLGFSHNI